MNNQVARAHAARPGAETFREVVEWATSAYTQYRSGAVLNVLRVVIDWAKEKEDEAAKAQTSC